MIGQLSSLHSHTHSCVAFLPTHAQRVGPSAVGSGPVGDRSATLTRSWPSDRRLRAATRSTPVLVVYKKSTAYGHTRTGTTTLTPILPDNDERIGF